MSKTGKFSVVQGDGRCIIGIQYIESIITNVYLDIVGLKSVKLLGGEGTVREEVTSLRTLLHMFGEPSV